MGVDTDLESIESVTDQSKTDLDLDMSIFLDNKKDELMEFFDDDVLENFDKTLQEIEYKELVYDTSDVKKEAKGLKRLKNLFKKQLEIEPYDPDLHGPLCVFEGLPGYEEVERYWLREPYSFAVILYNRDSDDHIYYVVEPYMRDFEKVLLQDIKNRLRDTLIAVKLDEETNKELILKEKVNEIILDYRLRLEPVTYHKILYYVLRDYLELDKLTPIMQDPLIEDISCNGWDQPVFLFHKNYLNIQTNIYFSEAESNSFVVKLAQKSGKHISIAEPMVDSTMPDGSRIQMTLGKEVTTHGSTFTIRKFKDVPISPVDLIGWKTFSSESMAYLWMCIENNKSLIFAGGTASGKTSSLNAVSLFIPHKAKIITLEDTRELKLPHPNWIPDVTREALSQDGKGNIDMYELLRAALRQRPEYLLVGEVRGKEALTLFQAMSTGHTTFSTMHADAVDTVIHRLENPPISVPRTMIEALDIVSIQSQTFSGGKRVRRNLELVEISEIDPSTRNIKTIDVFKWDPSRDVFERVGESKVLNDIMTFRAWSRSDMEYELKKRQAVLDYMLENNVRDFDAIATIIHAFQANQEKVMSKLNIKV
ncbi:MAG: type II secretion system protein E [Candidatus Syntrophoarchaeum caldarius]|uniref:Type II secretion system protein E n=1 Tax=Candidatus Syntropharchaeum caldarium TaxID=1838285 RepID=A0A1F2P995_9EURY|nr:MAG: type II secretion system protein E [Candidatus Syntrophoarchaeum caldarius]